MPMVPARALDPSLPPGRLGLIRSIEKVWVNGTVLHYCFLDKPAGWKGAANQKQAVRDAFAEWKQLGIGLEFVEVTDPGEAEIRIGFARDDGSWSYVGRDSIDQVNGKTDRTMNFGWDLTTPYGRDTALHEIGHALGFPHEHQNPNAGIVWNEPKVYAYFAGSPNYWDQQTTEFNIIRKISPMEVEGSSWDKDSIMHYQFEAGLIDAPTDYKTNPLLPKPGLSNTDIDRVRRFYPPMQHDLHPVLKAFESRPIRIAPGEQVDFRIRPEYSRYYTVQTVGPLDTVMVLFEEIDGTPMYIDGDDDSGTSLNAQIRAHLRSGRSYVVRVRLYFADQEGEGAILLS